jgi:hypothetical protein
VIQISGSVISFFSTFLETYRSVFRKYHATVLPLRTGICTFSRFGDEIDAGCISAQALVFATAYASVQEPCIAALV